MATTQYLDYAGLQALVAAIKAADKVVKDFAGDLTGKVDKDGKAYTSVQAYLEAEIAKAQAAATFDGKAASVTVADAAGLLTATDVEAALAELATSIATLNGSATTAGSVAKALSDAIGNLGSYSTVKDYVDAMGVAVKTLIHGQTGSLNDLTTTDKTTIVAAINEVKTQVGNVDYSGKADKVTSATAGNFAGLDASGNLVDSGKKADDFDVAGAAAAVSGYGDGETAKTVKDVAGDVATLVGSDASKSVRTIANEELAKQLIPEGAKESLDTLEEIAAWIQKHPEDASAMNSAISTLEGKVGNAATVDDEGNPVAATGLIKDVADLKLAIGDGGSVEKAIKDAVEALDATVSQTAGTDGLALTVVQEDGKLKSVSGSIAANTYDAYGEAAKVQGATTATVKSLEDRLDDIGTIDPTTIAGLFA